MCKSLCSHFMALALLGLALLSGACQSIERAAPPTEESALFAVSDRILRGKLDVISANVDIYTIQIGSDIAYIGGDGLEIPKETGDLLRQLQGVDVLAGVHGYDFHFGRVLVVLCYGKLALGDQLHWTEVALAREALCARDDWRARALSLETGRWSAFLASLQTPHEESDDILLERFLQSASAHDIARDLAGWWVRMLGQKADDWPRDHVRIGTVTVRVSDAREVAKRLLESTLQLPYYLLTRYHWGELQEGHRIWILAEMRT